LTAACVFEQLREHNIFTVVKKYITFKLDQAATSNMIYFYLHLKQFCCFIVIARDTPSPAQFHPQIGVGTEGWVTK
jgi:hypothetical protein